MLRHFLILRKRVFHIILHLPAARESKLQQSELQCIFPRRKKDPPKRVFRFRMVRARGLEPPWGCPHTDLNRTRLPIPPRPQIGA